MGDGVKVGKTYNTKNSSMRELTFEHIYSAPPGFYSSPYFLACHEGSGSKYLKFAFERLTGEVASDTLASLDGSVALPKTHHRSLVNVIHVYRDMLKNFS